MFNALNMRYVCLLWAIGAMLPLSGCYYTNWIIERENLYSPLSYPVENMCVHNYQDAVITKNGSLLVLIDKIRTRQEITRKSLWKKCTLEIPLQAILAGDEAERSRYFIDESSAVPNALVLRHKYVKKGWPDLAETSNESQDKLSIRKTPKDRYYHPADFQHMLAGLEIPPGKAQALYYTEVPATVVVDPYKNTRLCMIYVYPGITSDRNEQIVLLIQTKVGTYSILRTYKLIFPIAVDVITLPVVLLLQ